jgi:hypothetical protein
MITVASRHSWHVAVHVRLLFVELSPPSEWSTCSQSCNGGNQTRTVTCMGDNGEPAFNDTKCAGLPREPLIQQCNTAPCVKYFWQIPE